jgi:hypothetical protein
MEKNLGPYMVALIVCPAVPLTGLRVILGFGRGVNGALAVSPVDPVTFT